MSSVDTDTNSVPVVESAPVESPATEAPAATLHDEISKAFAESEKAALPDSNGIEAQEASKEGVQRQRDPSGKFVKAEKKEAAQPEIETSQVIKPPSTWKKASKEAFAKLPPETQREILESEKERDRLFHAGRTELAKASKKYDGLDEIFEPYDREIIAAGSSRAQVVGQLLETQAWLNQDPVSGIRAMIASYGLTPEQVINGAGTEVNPEIQALRDQLNQVTQFIQGQTQTQANQVRESITQEIHSFASETDASGNVLRPDFPDLVNDITELALLIRHKNPNAAPRAVLTEAYERARRLNDGSFNSIVESKVQEQLTTRLNDAKTKAERAKLAGSSVTGAPGGGMAPTIPSDLRGTIEAAMDGRL